MAHDYLEDILPDRGPEYWRTGRGDQGEGGLMAEVTVITVWCCENCQRRLTPFLTPAWSPEVVWVHYSSWRINCSELPGPTNTALPRPTIKVLVNG